MSAPGLDRLLTSGWYGTANARFVALNTNGWYDGLPAILTPSGYEARVPILSGPKSNQQGVAIASNPAKPLCSLVTSGSNTVYTATSVEDTDGWDLSEVVRHNVVATEDGYVGQVLSTAGNVVTVTSWHAPGGSDMAGKAADLPADGQGATIHKVIVAESILIEADGLNNNVVWLGMTNAVSPDNSFPISNFLATENASLRLTAGLGRHLNLSKIWVLAYANQTLHWTTGGGGDS